MCVNGFLAILWHEKIWTCKFFSSISETASCMPLETFLFSTECQTMIPSSIITLMMNNQSKAGLGKLSPDNNCTLKPDLKKV